MEPPVSYPQSDSYQGRKVYGKRSGCAGKGCFGIIGAIVIIVAVIAIGYFFALPAIMPNSISGSFLDAEIVPTKSGEQKLWVLTDGSFNFIQTTKSPGRTSTGRECYFCKTWTYILNPKDQSVEKKIKTPYEDIITQIDLFYQDGKVWAFTRDYGENEPRIETFDPETGEKTMDTKQFLAQFPELSAGLATAYYDKADGVIRLKTKDGIDGLLYSIKDGKLYKDFSAMKKAAMKDSSETFVSILAGENSTSSPRKKLYKISGPSNKISDNLSSLDNFVEDDDRMKDYKLSSQSLGEKVYLEGIMYHTDKDCAIIIYLDQLGKKSNRFMTCVDLKTGKEKWTLGKDDLFEKMQIDEEDDVFSSLFFTKDKIGVKRRGNLVILQLQYEGLIGFDFETGKKLWEMDI
ncbi:MAG: hypothetical protein IT281_06805 [Ignavibacteria bacterium]|nr:hypothetical protein [Ignavibacteria bacterium]